MVELGFVGWDQREYTTRKVPETVRDWPNLMRAAKRNYVWPRICDSLIIKCVNTILTSAVSDIVRKRCVAFRVKTRVGHIHCTWGWRDDSFGTLRSSNNTGTTLQVSIPCLTRVGRARCMSEERNICINGASVDWTRVDYLDSIRYRYLHTCIGKIFYNT